ncbi:MAG: DUF6587 family protein [Variovorax sp.]
MTQEIAVGLIVALAAFYAVWRWMPAGWRRAAAARLAAGTWRAGLVDAQRAEKLAASLGKAGGCGSCDSRSSCAGKGAAASQTQRKAPAAGAR